MVRRLYRFLAARPRRSASPVRRSSNWVSRSTVRGISKHGAPSRPTPSRILPSRGTITFVPMRTLSSVLPPAGYAERAARDLVIHQDQPVGDHRPGADGAQGWVRVHHLAAEIRAGLLDWGKVITEPLQVVDDVGAVSEKEREEPHPPDPCDR